MSLYIPNKHKISRTCRRISRTNAKYPEHDAAYPEPTSEIVVMHTMCL